MLIWPLPILFFLLLAIVLPGTTFSPHKTSISVGLSLRKPSYIMRRFITSKLVPSSCSPLWGNNHLLACIKKRNHLYHKAKKNRSLLPTFLITVSAGTSLSYQHKLKASFLNRLSAVSSSSCKSFWSLFKKLKKKSSIISTLTHNDLTVTDPISKANLINDFFSQCFNSSVPPLSLSDIFPHSPTDCPSDLLCTPENIIQLISQLPCHTSTGHDGISSKMFKATDYSISVPLCKLFNYPSFWCFPNGLENISCNFYPQAVIT